MQGNNASGKPATQGAIDLDDLPTPEIELFGEELQKQLDGESYALRRDSAINKATDTLWEYDA